jgi:S-adenosylmethionine:tRNA ribosyltransferase-isomerase
MTAVADPLIAEGPVEATGGRQRSDVRLLVATPDGLVHRRFDELPAVLRAGDVLVVNTSATIPAAVPIEGEDRMVHLSGRQPGGRWLVELRRMSGGGSVPDDSGEPGAQVRVPGADLRLIERFATGAGPSARLWLADLVVNDAPSSGQGGHDARDLDPAVLAWLRAVGHPIRYGHAGTVWPLAAYQTVFARHPGSAEMPSAARPFTAALVTRLVTAGIELAPLVLHTGVSSLERSEQPYPEWFEVPATTATRVDAARAQGRRVIAVGTTVVRALESASVDGRVQPARGWTDLVVTPERGVATVDGMITGWHESEATHLDMLRAVAGDGLLEASYAAAGAHGYRWHEFGDSHLLLPR